MNTADMLIHVHPDLDANARDHLERWVEGRVGVDCAEFSRRTPLNALLVKYDPEEVQGMQILEMVRKIDPVAAMVGL